MEEKSKKKSVFGVVCKIIFIAVIVYTGMKAIGAFIAKKTKELEVKNEGKKSKKYLAVMNGQIIKPDKEQVEEIVKTYPTPFHLYDEAGINRKKWGFVLSRRITKIP